MPTSSPPSGLQRLQATASPALFARKVSQGRWKLANHLATLDKAITDTLIGKDDLRRLLVMMPPRHGKSELTSGHLPAWHTGVFPDRTTMLCSYAASIAHLFGRRNLALFDAHGPSLFGHRVNPRVSAAGEWELDGHRGGMTSRGIGGDQTGRGFHLGIIDDPIKNAEQAGSKTVRDSVWEWYQSTFYTRLEPDGAVIVIQTRWHMDDLAGRLLREMQDGGDQWRVVKMPAIGHDGAALWPERWSVEKLGEIKRAIGSYYWSALYDQEPIPEGGRIFRREWFDVVDAAPALCRRAVRFWDTASAEAGSDGDWSAGALVAEHQGTLYICDVQHGQWSPAARDRIIEDAARSDPLRYPDLQLWVEQEHGNSGKAVGHLMRQNLARFGCRTEVPTTNKVARSRPLQAQAEIKNVKLVRGNWNQRFLDELTAFPDGLHDDQVDAVSGAVIKLLGTPSNSGNIPKGLPAFNGRT
jgi:predicted phage terminase large subunit-like protein